MRAMTREKYIELARMQYQDDGAIEIDGNAKISQGADGQGSYVAAWLWVYNQDKEDA